MGFLKALPGKIGWIVHRLLIITIIFGHGIGPFQVQQNFPGGVGAASGRDNGPHYMLTKLDIEGNKPAEGAYLYRDKRCRQEIGYITSAMWSPAVKANIALAMVETKHLKGPIWAEIYYEKELRQYHKVARCEVQDKPFWAPARARATPPDDF